MIQRVDSLEKSFNITLDLPGSKSITNRALILAALCSSPSTLHGLLVSDDTRACQEALKQMKGSGYIHSQDAGTVARFLLPICVALGGTYYFDGSLRMRERPLKPLLHCLEQQGVTFEWLSTPYHMPFTFSSTGLKGGTIAINVTESSQFLSGLLMAAPMASRAVTLQSSERLSQKPYVQLTLHLMRHFGITYTLVNDYSIHINPQQYHAKTLKIEPDASTASYFFAAAALSKSSIKILNLHQKSAQGDLRFLSCLERMGCRIHYDDHAIEVIGPAELQGIDEVDVSGFSDTFMTIAAMAPFLPTKTTLHGLEHTRYQESDRVAAMIDGLTRIGIKTTHTKDSLTIFPGHPHAAVVHSHHDHRIAMSFSIIGLIIPGIMIEDAACVSKTCPTFFQLLERIILASKHHTAD